MSGHSKWANIKRAKGVNDAKRAKIFTKLSRAVTVAVKKGGGPDASANPVLRQAIDEARGANMPKENIERAIAKGSRGGPGLDLVELTVEGYGPGGVAFLVSSLTDNRNRTLAEVRTIFTRHGGSLGQPGSAAYIFAQNPDNPVFSITVESAAEAKKILEMVESLEDLDDVQAVLANFDIPDSILEQSAS